METEVALNSNFELARIGAAVTSSRFLGLLPRELVAAG